MPFIQESQIKSETQTGQAKIELNPELMGLSVSVEGVASVTVKVIPHGLTNPVTLEKGVVTKDQPALFQIPPSSMAFLEPSDAQAEYKYSVGQFA